MKTCQYCGGEYKNVPAHERFCKKNPKNTQTEDVKMTTSEAKKPSFFDRMSFIFKRKKPKIEEVISPEDLIQGLKPYEIPDHNPKTWLGKLTNKNKDFIQVVLVSEILEPKMFWAEKTGINRIQYKDRMFKLPRDIRGNVFFWHIDKKQPLVDTAEARESDAESSFHELQLFNMAYSVGRAAGANDLLNNLKLILIMMGACLLLTVFAILYLYNIEKGIKYDDAVIINSLNYLNQTRGW